MSTCAVGPCNEPRAPGEAFCYKHGPRLAGQKREAPKDPTARPDLICAHCGVSGQVVSRSVKVRRGVSRGKAVSAALTGAVSLLVVGIGRTETQTELSCRACGMTWHVG